MRDLKAITYSILCFVVLMTVPGEVFGLEPPFEIGRKAPSFVLPDLQGNDVSLDKSIKDKHVTVIIIWGVWCPYCREIMVKLRKTYDQYNHKGLEILAVSIRESAFKVRIFVNKLKPGFPVLIDEWAKLKEPYEVRDVPRIVILDNEGRVKYTAITTSHEQIIAMIEGAVAR